MNIDAMAYEPTMLDKVKSKAHEFMYLFVKIRHWVIRQLGGVPASYDGNLVAHAAHEMALAWPDHEHSKPYDMQDMMKQNLLDIVAVFSAQGHSGFSANYAISRVQKLMAYKLLMPLTGEGHEWSDAIGDCGTLQNKRLSAVFKNADGTCDYLDAIVWRGEDDYDSFTGSVEGIFSRQTITFPFVPKTFYIDVKRETYDAKKHGEDAGVYADVDAIEGGGGDYVYVIKDRSQLKPVWEHYVKPEAES